MFRRTHLTVIIALSLMLVAQGTGAVAQEEPYAPVIDPANFVDEVDNPYFPLTPGATFIYEGETEDGAERIEVSVLPETKQILGVACRIVRDTVWVDGELVEDTFDWYAQDRDGNVWYMGEDSREYEDGVIVGAAGSWEAGVDGAQPGIIMQADPQVGERYRQEYYVGEAEDMAEVLSLRESASVPYGSFENLLMTNEWTPLEPDVAEHKYYASGVGLIFEVVVEGGTGQTELVNLITRNSAAEDDDADDEREESEAMLGGTPVITAGKALEVAEAHLGAGTAHEVELEYEGGRLVYAVEIGTDEVTIDAITGEVLSVEADD